ncbi:hypothetical protein EC957_004889 [Mortierella hygrophila]|uniref:Uncharacterized protein n=1 Tax=Mortierella hygrophila TaxID=979708 RepID=A0A9P6F1X2_9FUNG|nr:hypothetical protein EC957_004889 [Mortierella hygrophila]
MPPPPQPQPPPPPQVNTTSTSTSTSNSTTTNNKDEQESVDPIRDWLSSFITGLELLLESFRSLSTSTTDTSTKQTLLKLSLRCLALQTTLSFISFATSAFHSARSSGGGPLAHTPLFFPYILLYRYLFPKRWDQLFTSTVRSLNCTNRSDIVAKPSPRYFVQLKGFLRRMVKAHIELKLLNWLVHGRTASVFYYPSAALALLASYFYIKSKQTAFFWKLVLILAFLLGSGNNRAAGPVWVVQTIYLQDWFLYELLQPYLARVQFKPWEEKAWLDRYQTELYGFVLGAWLICKIPWVGVAAIPALMPAIAFLLTRSCGSMENTSQGRSAGRAGTGAGTGSGDLIERRAPGVKQVAQGTHPSVRGDWDSIKVLTMVQSDPDYADQATRDFKPQNHDLNWKNSSLHYSVDKGFDSALTQTQIEEDRTRSQLARGALYQEAEREAHRQFRGGFRGHGGFGGPSLQGRGFGRGSWNMRMDPRFAMHPHTGGPSSSSAPASGSTTTESISTPTVSSKHNKDHKAATGIYDSLGEDLTKYNFSDRKTLDSAPSAPPEEDLLPSEAGARAGGQNTMHLDSTTTHHTRTRSVPTSDNSQSARDNGISIREQEIMFQDLERMIREQEGVLRDEENQFRLRENRIRAQDNQTRAAEQIERARSQTDGGGGGGGRGSRERDEEVMEDGDEAHEDQEEEKEEEEEYQAQEEVEGEYQEENVDEAYQPSARGFGFLRGGHGGRGMTGFTPRGRGGRGGAGGSAGDGGINTGVGALRGFMRGIATRGRERGIGHRGRGHSRRGQSQSQQGQDQEQRQGRGHDRLRSRSHSDNHHHHHPATASRSSSTSSSNPTSTSAPSSSRGQQEPSDSTTTSGAPDFSYLSETITQGMAQFEQQLNQRMHAWGNQWFQKLRDAVTDPDSPGVIRFKYETS